MRFQHFMICVKIKRGLCDARFYNVEIHLIKYCELSRDEALTKKSS